MKEKSKLGLAMVRPISAEDGEIREEEEEEERSLLTNSTKAACFLLLLAANTTERKKRNSESGGVNMPIDRQGSFRHRKENVKKKNRNKTNKSSDHVRKRNT